MFKCVCKPVINPIPLTNRIFRDSHTTKMAFLEYLRLTKDLINYVKPHMYVHVVLGNESCDLDSMVSSLALAYHYSKQEKFNDTLVVGMINKSRTLFPIRVENMYLLAKYQIPIESLVFRDTVSLETLSKQCKLQITLVDHHVIPETDQFLKPFVKEIIDHRPIDASEVWKEDVSKEIELVGSCCTLVARKMNVNKESPLNLIGMLYDVITYDTISYKESAGKVTALDLEIAGNLEQLLVKSPAQRNEVFNEIYNAHRDISNLTSEQLLYKDLKSLGNIYIPGMPMLVKEFLRRSDAVDAIMNFSTKHDAKFVLVMGLTAESGEVQRDLALYCTDDDLVKMLEGTLVEKFSAQREDCTQCISHLHYYSQSNSVLSRKQLIPLIKLLNI